MLHGSDSTLSPAYAAEMLAAHPRTDRQPGDIPSAGKIRIHFSPQFFQPLSICPARHTLSQPGDESGKMAQHTAVARAEHLVMQGGNHRRQILSIRLGHHRFVPCQPSGEMHPDEPPALLIRKECLRRIVGRDKSFASLDASPLTLSQHPALPSQRHDHFGPSETGTHHAKGRRDIAEPAKLHSLIHQRRAFRRADDSLPGLRPNNVGLD